MAEKKTRRPAGTRKPGGPKKYRYVMTVVETVVYTTAIDSERKVKLDELKDIAETRRTHGDLSFKCVVDTDSWVEEAYAGGLRADVSRALA